MRLTIASDLHLEFADIELKNDSNTDMLVLAGDICVVNDIKEYVYFFERVSKEFPRVLYIMGNHEHYNGDYATTYNVLKQVLNPFSNIHLLEKESFELDGITFIGGTMWTDMNGYDKTSMAIIGSMMNDFRCVRNSNRYTHRKVPLYQKDDNGDNVKTGMKMKQTVSKFSVDDAYNDHKRFLDYLDGFLLKDNKLVVVTHHAPSGQSTPLEYLNQYEMNGGYRSHLDHLIEDHPNIKLWIHGHMHDPVDYTIGKTRVFANPRGYLGYETQAKNFVLKTIEL